MKKSFLIVVDMQNDFIDGSLGSAEAQAIVSPAADLIRKKRAEGYEVIATLDTHTDEYLSTREGKYLPVEHCIKGSEGWQLNPEIKDALEEALTLEKPTFGSVKLPGIVAERAGGDPAPVIELLGLCTDICVVSNAMLLKAAFPEADLRVHAACCAGVTPQKHEAALETMRSCQIDII
ncbi:MAG: cysteine hydrolase [Clostridia bacterium]|nr:cysteine hydrolase [Clostridia bacterium]